MTEKSALTSKLKQVLRQLAPTLMCISGFAVALIVLIVLSATPQGLTLLIVGRLTGPIPLGPISLLPSLVFILFVLLAALLSKAVFRVSKKLVKNGVKLAVLSIVLSLIVTLLVTSLFLLVFMLQVSENGEIIDNFVSENANLGFQECVNNVSPFLNSNVKNAYRKPEAIFKIDILVSRTLLDPYIMQIWGVTKSDVIVYQGWGTCEQAALLIEELLRRGGYQTRLARFIGIDHEWAEVKHNGTWLIVDPWYIGNLVDIQTLPNAKPDFQKATGVEVQYYNGVTWIDASKEHGY